MTSGSVEFLDPGGGSLDTTDGVTFAPASRAASRLFGPAAVAGLLAAGVLALAAPFQTAYSTSYTGADLPPQRADVDGWGRTTGVGVTNVFGHDPRIGIGLTFVACALVGVACAATVSLLRPAAAGLRRAVGACAGALAGLIVGVNGVTWLNIDSAGSQVEAANRQAAGLGQNAGSADTASALPTLHIALGAGPWLGTAAAACAAAATIVYLCRRTPDARPRPAAHPLSRVPATGGTTERIDESDTIG